MPTLSIRRPGALKLVNLYPRSAVLAVVLFASSTGVLCAQSTNASVAGCVTDPSKAVLVDARVAAISTGTNVRYEAATNGSVDYYLTSLPPGCYLLQTEMPRVKKLIRPDVTLHVQESLAIGSEVTW